MRAIDRSSYKLNKEQEQVYTKFTSLLAEFDSYIMVSILEDALRDAKKKTMLSDYGSCGAT